MPASGGVFVDMRNTGLQHAFLPPFIKTYMACLSVTLSLYIAVSISCCVWRPPSLVAVVEGRRRAWHLLLLLLPPFSLAPTPPTIYLLLKHSTTSVFPVSVHASFIYSTLPYVICVWELLTRHSIRQMEDRWWWVGGRICFGLGRQAWVTSGKEGHGMSLLSPYPRALWVNNSSFMPISNSSLSPLSPLGWRGGSFSHAACVRARWHGRGAVPATSSFHLLVAAEQNRVCWQQQQHL